MIASVPIRNIPDLSATSALEVEVFVMPQDPSITRISSPNQINELLFGKTISAANIFLMPLNCYIPGKGSHCVTLVLEKGFGSQFLVLRFEQHHFVQLPMPEGRVQRLAYIKQTVTTEPSRKLPSTFVLEPPVSDMQVTYVAGKCFGNSAISGFDQDWESTGILSSGLSYARVFSVNEGTSRSSFAVVVELWKRIPGVYLIALDLDSGLEEAWKIYTKTSSYRRGVDRSLLVLPGGAHVTSALKRAAGAADFKVETKVLPHSAPHG